MATYTSKDPDLRSFTNRCISSLATLLVFGVNYLIAIVISYFTRSTVWDDFLLVSLFFITYHICLRIRV